MNTFFLSFFFLFTIQCGFSQKPVVDTSLFRNWPSVGLVSISNDGTYAIFIIEHVPQKSNTLLIKSIHTNWFIEFQNVLSASFTNDNKFVIFKTSQDTLSIFNLKTSNVTYISNIKYFSLPEGKGKYLAYSKKSDADKLIIRNLDTEEEMCFDNVINSIFNDTSGILLTHSIERTDSNDLQTLQKVDLSTGKTNVFWHGERVINFVLNEKGQLAFITEIKEWKGSMNELWYYNLAKTKAEILVKKEIAEIDSNLCLAQEKPSFSKDGSRIFLKLIEKKIQKNNSTGVKVDIWSYKDTILQSEQLFNSGPHQYTAVVNLIDGRLIQLQRGDEVILEGPEDFSNNYILVAKHERINGKSEGGWARQFGIFAVSVLDGSYKIIQDHVPYLQPLCFRLPTSPTDKWAIYFDIIKKVYFSYEFSNGKRRNICKNIPVSLNDHNYSDYPQYGAVHPVGVGGWIDGDSAVLIYDEYDIWKVDPYGIKMPINITRGYGRAHHIKFRLVEQPNASKSLSLEKGILLTAFNSVTKYNGFFHLSSNAKKPKLLTMGPYVWYYLPSQQQPHSRGYSFTPLKAKDADVWIVRRMSATEAPDCYATTDFKSYTRLSNVQPQKNYNWLTTQLVHWKDKTNNTFTGILYKPEDFDPKKKYPLILHYYERLSDMMYNYIVPDFFHDNINIPFFVSKGYLVLVPDIYYKIGSPGESAVNCVVSAADFLSKMTWVDAKKIGIQGHSWGGFQTNYIVTHTHHIFAAAAEAAGRTDFISGYGALNTQGQSLQDLYESYQFRIGKTLWQRPDLYIKNSPILAANQVITPLLMTQNKGDNGGFPWAQGVGFFTALRRLNKKVWMLQYDASGHTVATRDVVDYTIRLTQFFDYYLKEALPPKWMTEGIPASRKGIDSGYELDTSGKKP